ncbi:hypothetical protein AKJ16_DCAP21926 [Drosera capensis]
MYPVCVLELVTILLSRAREDRDTRKPGTAGGRAQLMIGKKRRDNRGRMSKDRKTWDDLSSPVEDHPLLMHGAVTRIKSLSKVKSHRTDKWTTLSIPVRTARVVVVVVVDDDDDFLFYSALKPSGVYYTSNSHLGSSNENSKTLI